MCAHVTGATTQTVAMMKATTQLSQCSRDVNKGMSQSVRTCSQCTATTSAGTRCRKRTCRGPVCWQHAQTQHGLRVKPSQIQNAGFGLYATKRLAKNARIAPYTGEQRTRDQITQEYGTDTGQYVLCRSAAECFDASMGVCECVFECEHTIVLEK